MKTLLILRHAKAQPDAPQGDHPRNLTDRGRRDAGTIGVVIRDLVGTPDGFVSSDANRALQTAELAAAACGYAGEIRTDRAIYLAEASELLNIVRAFPDSHNCIVLVGHNTGMEDLVAWLSRAEETEHLPTAGLAIFEVDSKRWADLSEKTSRVVRITSPREH